MHDTTSANGGHAVLVVDDDPDFRHAIQLALEDEGLSVQTAADGREALDRGMRERPAIVVLDMSLPLLGGERVALGIRAAHDQHVPILVITADGRAAEKATRVGAFDYLHKPFELDALVAAEHRGLS